MYYKLCYRTNYTTQCRLGSELYEFVLRPDHQKLSVPHRVHLQHHPHRQASPRRGPTPSPAYITVQLVFLSHISPPWSQRSRSRVSCLDVLASIGDWILTLLGFLIFFGIPKTFCYRNPILSFQVFEWNHSVFPLSLGSHFSASIDDQAALHPILPSAKVLFVQLTHNRTVLDVCNFVHMIHIEPIYGQETVAFACCCIKHRLWAIRSSAHLWTNICENTSIRVASK